MHICRISLCRQYLIDRSRCSRKMSGAGMSLRNPTISPPQWTPKNSSSVRFQGGRRGRARTCNPRLRRPVLCPVELLARAPYCNFCSSPPRRPAVIRNPGTHWIGLSRGFNDREGTGPVERKIAKVVPFLPTRSEERKRIEPLCLSIKPLEAHSPRPDPLSSLVVKNGS
jgi:hypothetical protein